LRRVLNWAVWLPVTVLVVGFAVANRQWIEVSFDPFDTTDPFASIAMPQWALLFCGLFIGTIAGWTVCWFGQSKWRKSTRDALGELRRAHSEIDSLKRDTTLPAENLPSAGTDSIR
jgi:hypothetical protein